MKKILFLLFLFSFAIASALNCSVCRKKIKGKYMQSKDKKIFCSKTCFAQTAPKCNSCKNPCVEGVFTFMKKTYCSKNCLEKVSRCNSCSTPTSKIFIIVAPDGEKLFFCSNCVKNPKCFFCTFPRKTKKIYDGRHVCSICLKNAVTSHDEIRKIFRKIRHKLHRMYGFDINHTIELNIISLPQLEKLSRDIYKMENGSRVALMRYEFTVNEKSDWRGRRSKSLAKERCRMFLLDNIPLDILEDSIAHELTHDYLRHNVGKVENLSVEEGFAEAIAAEYNKTVRRTKLNTRKQNTPDPVYGDGYRKMSAMLKKLGFKKTVQYIKTQHSKALF